MQLLCRLVLSTVVILAIAVKKLAKCEDRADESNNVGTQLASAFLGTFFPELDSNQIKIGKKQQQPNAVLNTLFPNGRGGPSPNPIHGLLSQLFNSKANSIPQSSSDTGNLPSLVPQFPALTNPQVQDSVGKTALGFPGRIDLPPNYTYPFAQPGSLILPSLGAAAAPIFSLNNQQNLQLQDKLKQLQHLMALQHIQNPESMPTTTNPLINALLSNNSNLLRQQQQLSTSATDAAAVVNTFQNQTRQQQLLLERRRKLRLKQLKFPKIDPCLKCLTYEPQKLTGSWTEIFGNRDSIESIYSNLHIANNFGEVRKYTKPKCIGIHFGRLRQLLDSDIATLPVNLFYKKRNDSDDVVEQISGIGQIGVKRDILTLQFSALNLPMCLVKAGPSNSAMLEYIVLTEILGKNRCRNLHVFARKSQIFARDLSVEVVEDLRKQIVTGHSNPISIIPSPAECELNALHSIGTVVDRDEQL